MNNQAAKLVKTTAQLSLKLIQLRISDSIQIPMENEKRRPGAGGGVGDWGVWKAWWITFPPPSGRPSWTSIRCGP